MGVTFPSLSKRGNHSNCTAERCEADNIKPQEYQQKHVQHSCTCSEILPREAWDAMLKIIEQGGIRLVRVKPRSHSLGGSIDFEIVLAGPSTRYLAYSHVWADGRGNVSGNEVYECQWRWLQECAQQYGKRDMDICSAPSENLLFWIDTFCVPRGCDERMWQLRTKAILSMSEIYRKAEVVVVLDSALENAEITSVLEFGMLLKFCGWVPLCLEVARRSSPARVDNQDEKGPRQSANDQLPDGESEMIDRFSPSVKATFFNARREVHKRATSYPSDRYLVMGIISQANKETLLALQGTGDDNRNTEEVGLAKLNLILLFAEFGMQGAPETIGGDIPEDKSDVPARRIPGKGAIVRLQRWRIVSSPQKLHISASFITVKLEQAARYQDRYKLAVWPTDKNRKDFVTLVSLISPNARLAIILSAVPGLNDTAVNFKLGLLVEEIRSLVGEGVQDVEEDSVVHVKYLAVLRVYAIHGDGNSMQGMEAEWFNQGMDKLWCIG
ncbi:uncharacterized protein Z519_08592 [Cladophialophora bantiana CBS 173.52]|uniref:Heterokaryon incompatibility domain-containing protein n=1 Tax=Cladophialophora bantiana (strain ATCC 10958 / CBS 173.52 / CDC B-1940 / NIH 8579) TaxID=1442370 RepID=A0A0D2I1M1_CLAB1|nr:uncharacterized protein Z519_08592 [Cladophialophora bantiana CBS 173.52]KIW90809.1 hypothetical protein Z519_08592 [Cladophialophora bantiana CBS 173.52]